MLFNYSWLHAKISSGPIANVLDDFTRALSFVKKPEFKRQVGLNYLMEISLVSDWQFISKLCYLLEQCDIKYLGIE